MIHSEINSIQYQMPPVWATVCFYCCDDDDDDDDDDDVGVGVGDDDDDPRLQLLYHPRKSRSTGGAAFAAKIAKVELENYNNALFMIIILEPTMKDDRDISF